MTKASVIQGTHRCDVHAPSVFARLFAAYYECKTKFPQLSWKAGLVGPAHPPYQLRVPRGSEATVRSSLPRG